MTETHGAEAPTPALLRRLLLGVLWLSTFGVLAELYLLEHYAVRWQWTPIVLLGAGALVAGWALFKPSRASLRSLQVLMLLFLVSGGLGVWLHFSANLEFELEIYPDKGGAELMWDALTGAFPTLAPGTMALLGAIGLIATLRHPRLGHRD